MKKTETCKKCKRTSTLPELFIQSGDGKVCPACAMKEQKVNAQIAYLVFGFMLLLDGLLNVLYSGELANWNSWIAVNIFLIAASSVVFHELSHAVMAKLLGGHVFGIHIGHGALFFRRWLGNFYIGVSALPFSGVCYAAFSKRKFIHVRQFLVTAAGPASHLLWIGVGLSVIEGIEDSVERLFVIVLILFNIFMLLANVYPRQVQTAAGSSGSDGQTLWRILTGQLSAQEMVQDYYRVGAIFALQKKHFKEARQLINKGLQNSPNDSHLKYLQAYLSLKKGNLEIAHKAWNQIIKSEEYSQTNGLIRALNFNNYVWTILLRRSDTKGLQTAKKYALQACAMAPWVPSIRSTLAAVYMEEGNYKKGIKLALDAVAEMEAMKLPELDDDIACTLSTLALAHYRRGNKKQAMTYLKKAQMLAADEPMVRKAANSIRSVGK